MSGGMRRGFPAPLVPYVRPLRTNLFDHFTPTVPIPSSFLSACVLFRFCRLCFAPTGSAETRAVRGTLGRAEGLLLCIPPPLLACARAPPEGAHAIGAFESIR
jgi:hypothetical protein